jgi:hypothetical protein
MIQFMNLKVVTVIKVDYYFTVVFRAKLETLGICLSNALLQNSKTL